MICVRFLINKANINWRFIEWIRCCTFWCNTTDLTLVIMGALFDLRSAPPAAPAHWSTSIRSILWSAGPAVAAPTAGLRPFDGGVGLYSSPVEARPAGLTSSKPRAAKSAGWTPKLSSLYRISLRKTPDPCVTAGQTVIYNPQLRFTCCCL